MASKPPLKSCDEDDIPLSSIRTSLAHDQIPSPLRALKLSLLSGKFSDLKVTHGKRVWSAHKVIVGSQSTVLESEIKEPKGSDDLDLSGYNYEAVCIMMEYLYTSSYTVSELPPSFSLLLHVDVFALAIRLSIPGLRQLSATRFRCTLHSLITNLDVYFNAVKSIYTLTTPAQPELRNIVAEAAVFEMRSLLDGPFRAGFLSLTTKVPDFQTDIYDLFIKNPSRPMELVEVRLELCGQCGPMTEDDGYEVTTECKHCGEERTLRFN